MNQIALRGGSRRPVSINFIVILLLAYRPTGAVSPIDLAVESARRYLKEELRRGRFPHSAYPMGIRSLYLYALLEAGEDPSDPLIEKTLRYVASLPLRATYSVSLHILALHRWALARGEAPLLRAGQSASDLSLLGPYRRRMEELVWWLLKAKRSEAALWTYGMYAGEDHDNSNTQFAVTALEAAARQGVSVPAELFAQIGATFIANATESGPSSVVRVSVEFGEPFGRAVRKSISLRVVPAGWGYQSGGVPTFSMTCAGLSSLGTARWGIARFRRPDRSFSARLEEALRRAAAWIALRWDDLARLRPGPGQAQRRYYYTLYSLEKAGDSAGILRFGSHRWYEEEAAFLLRDQAEDGHWGRNGWEGVATSFSILFLRRASARFRPLKQLIYARSPAAAAGRDDFVFLGELNGGVSLGALLCLAFLRGDQEALALAQRGLDAFAEEHRATAVPTLVALARGGSNPVRRFALVNLRAITGENERDLGRYEKWYALWTVLRGSPEPVGLERLLSVLKEAGESGFESLQVLCLRRIAGLQQPEAIESILPFLQSEDPRVRAACAACLAKLSGGRFGKSPPKDPTDGAALRRKVAAFIRSGGLERIIEARVEQALAETLKKPAPALDLKAMDLLRRYRSEAVRVILRHLQGEAIDRRFFVLLAELTDLNLGVDPIGWRKALGEAEDRK